jgi:hypothetical protein
VVRVESGSRFRIAEERGGVERELVAKPGPGGAPRLEYEVDGKARTFDAEGRAWLAHLLPEVFRASGLDAEGRVGRILRRGGFDAVLAESARIRSDYVQRIYLAELLDQVRASEAQVRRVVALATRDLESDYDLAELLVGALASYPAEAVVGGDFAPVCAAIDSDYDLRRVLGEVMARARTHAPAEQALPCLRHVDSDYDTAEVLVAAAGRWPSGRELPAAFFVAARRMQSDYDRRRSLQAVTARRPAMATDLQHVLESAEEFSSDYDLAELLVATAEAGEPLHGALADAYLAAARGISSSHDRQRALAALVDVR